MSTLRQVKTFPLDEVIAALESKGIHYQVEGRQINADLHGTGHHHIKITPHKGLYLDASTGKGGTIAQLLRQIGAQQPQATTPHPAVGGQARQPTKPNPDKPQQIWASAWTCTHANDMPSGWDKGLKASQKGPRRAALERQRNALRSYLTSRLGPDHLDHWCRQVRIGNDGLMLNPMQNGGVITGIQRTYFDHDGQKSERKMLGPHGTTFCSVPFGVNPRDLGVGAVKLAGEGWETIASTVQAAGWPGLACQFDGGVVKWATEQASQASQAQSMTVVNAPAVVVLVDRDVSVAGQRAAARAVKILRRAGLKAFYAIPPSPKNGGPKGGPKGSDWGDYPREGISADVLAAHLALAIAHGDQEMPNVDDPGMTLPAPVIRAWRPAKTPQTPAQSGPTHEVRAGLQTALQQTVRAYLEWMKDDKPFRPVLMMPTTGTGKSTSAKALTRHAGLRLESGRVCIFVPDHAQAAEYENSGFFHFWGRNPIEDSPGYCQNYQTAQEILEQGHISQAELCKNCSNGFAWQIEQNKFSDSPAAQKKVAKAKKILKSRGIDWEEVEPCVWQEHLRDAIGSQFVVAASGSYSHSLTRNSLVIFDEHFEPGKGYPITLQDVDHWARRNQSIIIACCDGKKLKLHKKLADFFKALAISMAEWVGKSGAISVDKKLLEAIQGILDAAKKASKSSDDVTLADWETLRFNHSGELDDNPLRAAHAIAETLKFGDGFVDNGKLVVAASFPIMERLANGQPTVIMDATPDPVIFDVLQGQEGRIINAIAHQNVRIHRYPTRFWGLTPLNTKLRGVARRDREIEKYKAIMGYHNGAACLFHKRAADQIDPEDENQMLGHWGKHHRAHNAWSGKPLVIVGSFFPPMEVWRGEYQRSRIAALSAGANPENWPAWRDDMEVNQGEWICEGSHEVESNLPLPADDRIRAWLLNRVTAETVQAVGRGRGANSETTLEIHIYGGVPLYGLWEHGLSVDSYHDDPECLGQTKAQHMEEMRGQRDDSLSRCDALAARIIAKGGIVTRKALQCAVDEINAEIRGGQDEESYLWGGGMNIYTTPPQIQMPDTAVINDWIKKRMPVLSSHLSTKGRNGKLVKEAQAIARKFGETALADAMKFAENLVKAEQKAHNIETKAWHIIENDPHATDMQIAGSRLALTSIGATENVPVPWTADDSKGSVL